MKFPHCASLIAWMSVKKMSSNWIDAPLTCHIKHVVAFKVSVLIKEGVILGLVMIGNRLQLNFWCILDSFFDMAVFQNMFQVNLICAFGWWSNGSIKCDVIEMVNVIIIIRKMSVLWILMVLVVKSFIFLDAISQILLVKWCSEKEKNNIGLVV